jgi:D-arginine dehydrogenase
MAQERTEFLIVGGGVAGLSTALHLALEGHGPGVTLLEREDLPGFYASGHNAGIGRQLTGRAEHTTLTVAGLGKLMKASLLDSTGGLLLGADPGGTESLALEASRFSLPTKRGSGGVLPGLNAAEYLRIPSDGVIDIDSMLRYCSDGARSRGAQLRFGCGVKAIHPGSTGFEVETDRGTITARFLINAAGAWAQTIGWQAGGLDISFMPLRRHLVWSPAPTEARNPWAWWADRNLYVRPESGGLLMCACEEQETTLPQRGQQPDCDSSVLSLLSQQLKELAPSLEEAPIARLWCGLRTFAPDRRFVIGHDPLNPRLFWVAGLGGHGMTSGLAVGELAARTLLHTADPGLLAPDRLPQMVTAQL